MGARLQEVHGNVVETFFFIFFFDRRELVYAAKINSV